MPALVASASAGLEEGLPDTRVIQTVRGPVPASQIGLSLCHEHVLVDFIGADEVSPDRYNADEVVVVARPHLERAMQLGVKAFFECTPAFLARDPALLRRLSESTGMHLVTNTGLYGAAGDKFLPSYALAESARQLAARWIGEAREGIEGTGIRPGFIKSGVDADDVLSEVDRKLIEAAALAHRETGLTIAVHTGRGPGLEIIAILRSLGVRADAFIWVHAQNAPEDAMLRAAEAGAWVSLDGIGPRSLELHAARLEALRERGLLHRALISHDAGWFDPAKPGGGEFRGFELLFTEFIPLLRQRGFADEVITSLLVRNVAHAFAVRPRLLQDHPVVFQEKQRPD